MSNKNATENKRKKSTGAVFLSLSLIVLLALGILITVHMRSEAKKATDTPAVSTEVPKAGITETKKDKADEIKAPEDKTEKTPEPEKKDPPAETVAEPEQTEVAPRELKAVVSEEELRGLDLEGVTRLDLTGSNCYAAIEALKREHPEIDVVYAVIVNGGGDALELAPDTKSLHITDASYLSSLEDNASWLPELTAISLETDIAEPAEIEALKEAYPDSAVSYSMTLNGMQYPYDIEEIRLTGLDADALNALLPELARFTCLRSVSIPEADNAISAEEALDAAKKNPLITLDYEIELFGQTVSLASERLEFENEDIGNEGVEELRAVLPSFKNLQYLKLDSCGIDNETMAQLRDDFPDIKVVWRVFFGEYHCLTDTEMIWATGGTVNDSTVGVLKYCTDVKYLDLGHALMTHVDFLAYMPKLEVAILAISWVEDIGPIANCPNLEYLELFSTRVMDFTPLASCTHLQHLNISHSWNANNETIGPRDISPLYDLPELKRFYCTMSYVPEEQQQIMQERHPDCECNFKWEDPAEGPWRFDENGDRNERYALLCEQFGYDTYQQSGKTWSLY